MTFNELSYHFDRKRGLVSMTVKDIPIENLMRMLVLDRREYEIEKQNLSPPQECFS